MVATSRRTTVFLTGGIGVAVALALVPAAPGGSDRVPVAAASAVAAPPQAPSAAAPTSAVPSAQPSKPWDGKVRVIGDGSTSDTGPQPNQPEPEKLKPGERPPQFVVFSWDGAREDDNHLFSHFRQLAQDDNAQMTFFLSGIYLLPKSKRFLYHPPQHAVGASDIDYLTDAHIKATLAQVSGAWADGHEIGTHFNGHFCGTGGGGNWSPAEWQSEIDQAISFVNNWKTNTGFTDLPPLPFDYQNELIGGRTPCLEGQKTLLPAERRWAGGTTPARRAASRSGRRRWAESGTSRCSPCRSRARPSRSSRWTTTSWPTSPAATPRVTRASTRAGRRRPSRATWPASTAPTTATGRRCSSATTSRSGTAAST